MKKIITSSITLINILLAFFLTFIFLYIKKIYQHEFGGYDLSIIIDMAHRLENGKKPGIDFISTYPISFICWLKLNLLFFPNNWNSLYYSGFTHFLFCILGIYVVLYYNNFFKRSTILLIVIVFLVPLFVTNHIWPSYYSEYTALVLYVPLSIIILTGKINTADYIIIALFTGLSLFSKQNVGILTTFLYVVMLFVCYFNKLLSKKQLINLLLVATISVVFFLTTIYIFLGMNTIGIIKTYTAVLGRSFPAKGQLIEVFMWNENFWICLVMFLFGTITLYFAIKILNSATADKRIRVFIWFNIFIQVIGYYSVLTNWDTKLNDFTLIAISNLFVLFTIKKNVLTYAYTGFILLIFCYSVYLGNIRYRMRNIGIGSFYEPVANYQITNGYLKGVYCGPILYFSNRELVNLKQSGFLKGKVFFGPRMEFGYEQYQFLSPEHMPIWWHPGSSYGLKDERAVIDTFKLSNFNNLVFLKNDRTRMPNEILNYIKLNYTQSRPSAYLDIYTKK